MIVLRVLGYLIGAALAVVVFSVLAVIFVLDQTIGRLTIFGHSVSAHVFHPILDGIINGLSMVMERAANR